MCLQASSFQATQAATAGSGAIPATTKASTEAVQTSSAPLINTPTVAPAAPANPTSASFTPLGTPATGAKSGASVLPEGDAAAAAATPAAAPAAFLQAQPAGAAGAGALVSGGR